jgi:hypothetical protein
VVFREKARILSVPRGRACRKDNREAPSIGDKLPIEKRQCEIADYVEDSISRAFDKKTPLNREDIDRIQQSRVTLAHLEFLSK